MKGVVFLGGPVDSQPWYSQSWRDEAVTALGNKGIVAFNPVTAINWPKDASPRQHEFVRSMNFSVIQLCDVVLEKDPHLSVGASREIQVAVQTGKHVLVLLDLPNASPYLTDSGITVFYTLEGVLEFIIEQFSR